jgi:hypothetical protein
MTIAADRATTPLDVPTAILQRRSIACGLCSGAS